MQIPFMRHKLSFADRVEAHLIEVERLFRDLYISRHIYDARVTELLDANTREVERRREAMRQCEQLERDILKATQIAHQNAGLAQGLDWISHEIHSTEPGRGVLDRLKLFVKGFCAEPWQRSTGADQCAAYDAGMQAGQRHAALASAAQAMGLPIKA